MTWDKPETKAYLATKLSRARQNPAFAERSQRDAWQFRVKNHKRYDSSSVFTSSWTEWAEVCKPCNRVNINLETWHMSAHSDASLFLLVQRENSQGIHLSSGRSLLLRMWFFVFKRHYDLCRKTQTYIEHYEIVHDYIIVCNCDWFGHFCQEHLNAIKVSCIPGFISAFHFKNICQCQNL